jgi:hypothetical protein
MGGKRYPANGSSLWITTHQRDISPDRRIADAIRALALIEDFEFTWACGPPIDMKMG